MFKAVILLRRKPGLSPEEFVIAMRVHVQPLISRFPGMQRMVVSEAVAGPGGDPPYDIMAEIWLETIDDVRALTCSEITRTAETELAKYCDMDSYQTFLTVERKISEMATGGGVV